MAHHLSWPRGPARLPLLWGRPYRLKSHAKPNTLLRRNHCLTSSPRCYTHCFCSHCFCSCFRLPFYSASTPHRFRIKFEVANLDTFPAPESVTTLGEWSVKCWVASDHDPTYRFGEIFPHLSQLTMTTF
ncbi:hypothetical protein GWK47_025397 [Chionoecetes opilio]|uniref:Uncharacterized protein n=1 Tax=Chionoecetes opilio TaxID=41210 RepID=A0A8J8WDT4_CHIOP|nr:hypothetical protein GWK47_025397 [Chionoecetes opilio]